MIRADMPTDKGQSLRNLWSSGADFNPYVWGSPFMRACFLGELATVRASIASTGSDPDKRRRLLELRESQLRMSPLLGCIAGARVVPGGGDHKAVVQALLAAGARYAGLGGGCQCRYI